MRHGFSNIQVALVLIGLLVVVGLALGMTDVVVRESTGNVEDSSQDAGDRILCELTNLFSGGCGQRNRGGTGGTGPAPDAGACPPCDVTMNVTYTTYASPGDDEIKWEIDVTNNMPFTYYFYPDISSEAGVYPLSITKGKELASSESVTWNIDTSWWWDSGERFDGYEDYPQAFGVELYAKTSEGDVLARNHVFHDHEVEPNCTSSWGDLTLGCTWS